MDFRKRTKEESRTKNWNRNVFSFRTSDNASKSIKTFCKENELSHNIFLNNLIDDFFGKSISKQKIMEENLMRISVSVVKDHYEKIRKISDERHTSIGLTIRQAIDDFLSSSSSANIQKDPLVNSSKANRQNYTNEVIQSNQSGEDVFVKLEKLITYKNNGLISETEFKLLKSKLLNL